MTTADLSARFKVTGSDVAKQRMREFDAEMQRLNNSARGQQRSFSQLTALQRSWQSNLRSSLVSMVSFGAVLTGLGVSTAVVFQGIRQYAGGILAAQRAQERMRLQMRLLGLSTEDAAESVDRLTRGLSRQSVIALSQNAEAVQRVREAFSDWQAQELNPLAEFLSTNLPETVGGVDKVLLALAQFRETGDATGTALEGMVIQGESFEQFLARLQGEARDAEANMSEWQQATQTLGESMDSLFGSAGVQAIGAGVATIGATIADGLARILSGDILGWPRAVLDTLSGQWSATVVPWWENTLDNLRERFTSFWTLLRVGVPALISGLRDAIGSQFRAALNAVIIGPLNAAIERINSFQAQVPDWVPQFGGNTIGFNIPSIPQLAEGGIVRRPTLALIGERGPEAVTPLNGRGGMQTIVVQVGDRTLAEVVLDVLGREIAHREPGLL